MGSNEFGRTVHDDFKSLGELKQQEGDGMTLFSTWKGT